MINFFTLILLALLILLKIILVTAIFNNLSFKENEKDFKTKILIRDILEAILLISVIFVLVTKYLEFINISSSKAYIWGVIVAIITLVLYLLANFNFLDKYYKENFQCKTIDELHSDTIPHFTDNRIFSMVPSQTLLSCSDNNNYSFKEKYPFTHGNINNLVDTNDELLEYNNTVFNNSENPNMKLIVVDLTNNDLKTVI